MKNAVTRFIATIALFMCITFLAHHLLFAAAAITANTTTVNASDTMDVEDCELFALSFDCRLTAWHHLLIGDITIGITLGILLHYLTHRSNIKLASISKITQNNSDKIQKILINQEEVRKRRKKYVIQSIKNQLSALLLCISLINKLASSHNNPNQKDNTLSIEQGYEEIKNLLQKMQHSLDLSIDVLDPMLVYQIEKLRGTIEQNLLQDNKKPQKEKILLKNYKKIKENVMTLTKRLNESSDLDDVIK